MINRSKNEAINLYHCVDEPIMKCNERSSVNQIDLLYKYGPNNTLFSPKKVRVGIFCLEEDKLKFNNYINQMINGTNCLDSIKGIIPKFPGFKKIFNTEIEIVDELKKFTLLNVKRCDFNRFADFCCRGIDILYKDYNVDIVLIYISDKLGQFRKENEKDLHDLVKLRCLNTYKTQFIEEKSIDSADDINKKLFSK